MIKIDWLIDWLGVIFWLIGGHFWPLLGVIFDPFWPPPGGSFWTPPRIEKGRFLRVFGQKMPFWGVPPIKMAFLGSKIALFYRPWPRKPLRKPHFWPLFGGILTPPRKKKGRFLRVFGQKTPFWGYSTSPAIEKGQKMGKNRKNDQFLIDFLLARALILKKKWNFQ